MILRRRGLQLGEVTRTNEYHHQIAIHQIGPKGRDASEETAQKAQELEQNIADAKAKMNCLLLGRCLWPVCFWGRRR